MFIFVCLWELRSICLLKLQYLYGCFSSHIQHWYFSVYILGIHYIQTFICLWPFVYCWWPYETPEVEQLKLEMDPWLLVVSSGCKCWGWSTRLRQTKTDPNAGVIFVFCWCSTLFGMMILLKSEQRMFFVQRVVHG